MAKEKSSRKIELTEEDFLLILDLKHTLEVTSQSLIQKLDHVLQRHTVRDPAWKGQLVQLEGKKKVSLDT